MSWQDGDYYNASFGVHKCRRYHQKMRDHYRRLHRMLVIANIVGGSAAFVAVMSPWQAAAALFTGIVAAASIIDYIFSAERASTAHHDLAVRFTRLASEMELLAEIPENLAAVRAKRLEIEVDEPSELRLVDLMAANDESRARGVPERELIPLSWAQSRLGYFGTFGMARIEDRKRRHEDAEAALQQHA